MPYVQRDNEGKIIALLDAPSARANELMPVDDPEVLSFLSAGDSKNELTQLLAHTDSEIIRILEDLVDLLVEKRIIRFTDLPESAQDKLLSRRRTRARLRGPESPVIEQSDIL